MSHEKITAKLESPFGALTATEVNGALVSIDWKEPDVDMSSPLLERVKAQMAEYFAGTRKTFDLPLAPKGDAFQQSVCQEMLEIPYGETTTYGAIAEKLHTYGQPVGNACGNNTIPIIIPCHRVLAVQGLGGYSGEGGVERKIELLKHEGGFPYLL